MDAVLAGQFDVVVLLTGVGTRAWIEVAAHAGLRDAFVDALGRTRIAVRGPKPHAVLRELQIQPWVAAPEPNTWRELLTAIDQNVGAGRLAGQRVAVQEYGASNPDLMNGLTGRGAAVTRVPVYRWALPEDLGPLRSGINAIVEGTIDVALFTTATQVTHLFEVAGQMGVAPEVQQRLARVVVASIGPTTTEELREHGLTPDVEAAPPKMGVLAREAAAQSEAVLSRKRS